MEVAYGKALRRPCFVKDLKCEIGSPESHELSIHKTNFENWELELSANEEELHYFEEKQKRNL